MEPRDPETYAILGAAMEVHRELGCGFSEAAYQEALALELQAQHIPFKREVRLGLSYKGVELHSGFRPDFICYDRVIVELKALGKIGPIEESQLLNYLRVSCLPVGLLINFGAASLQFKRLVGPPHFVSASYHLHL